MSNTPKQIRRLAVSLLVVAGTLGAVLAMAGTSGANVTGSSVSLVGTAPTILGGVANQDVAGWTITMPGTDIANDQYSIVVNPSGLTGATLTCADLNDVAFSAVPAVTVAPTTGTGGTLPTFTTTVIKEPDTVSACDAVTNELNISVLTAGTIPTGGSTWTITISAVKYNVGAAATPDADVAMGDSSYQNSTASTPSPLTVQSNAKVSAVVGDVTIADNNDPRTALLSGDDTNQAISPISFTETVPGAVPTGYVCVELETGNVFDTTAPSGLPTITSAGGSVITPSTVSVSGGTASFDVTTASTTATTYTLGNLHVDGSSVPGPVTYTATTGNNVSCSADSPNSLDTDGLRAFTVLSYTVTAGAVADTTAADEMEAVYPPPENCPTDRSVVLATDSNFPDALSASYLAGQLKTGILLTPTATLSPDAANALREEGINNVYVVGGLDVVSQAVINTITSTPVYACGGTTLDPSDTTISEQTISGQTLYDTSEDIADFFLSSMVGKAAFPGAYGGSGGNGAFNDTTGISSATGPTSPVPTAIVATGAGFQDATVASVVGYSEHFPVILTTPTTLATQAQDALINDKIQQVILVGGEDAVSDAVVTQMEDLGISVLRVAGQDYTDTAVQLAYFELDNIPNTVGATGLGWDQDNDNQVTMARGDFYTDALAGAPFAALIADGHPQPILTTEDPSTLGTYLTGFLNLVGSDTGIFFEGPDSQVFTINVLGGQYAVNPTTISDALTALEAG